MQKFIVQERADFNSYILREIIYISKNALWWAYKISVRNYELVFDHFSIFTIWKSS